MTALVLMGVQMGVVMVGFVGASKMLEWYHKDESPRGGVRHGNRRSKRDDDFFF